MGKKTATVQLEYDSLIALLQGQELHIDLPELHAVFKSPFKGSFLTFEQIEKIRFEGMQELLRIVNQKGVHTQNVN